MALFIPAEYPNTMCPGTRIEGGQPRWGFGTGFNTQRLQRLYKEAIVGFRIIDMKDILRFFSASISGSKALLRMRIDQIEETLAAGHARGVRELYLAVLNHPRSEPTRHHAEHIAAQLGGAAAATVAASVPAARAPAPRQPVHDPRLASAMGLPASNPLAMAYAGGYPRPQEHYGGLGPEETRQRDAAIAASLDDVDAVLRDLDPFTKVLGRLAVPFRFVPATKSRHAFRLTMDANLIRDMRWGRVTVEVRAYALFPAVRAMCWPKECRVLVNGKPSCPTSQRTSGWNKPPIVPENPLRITGYVYTGISNTVEVQSLPEPGVFVFGVYSVVPMPLPELRAKIQGASTRGKEAAREWTKERLGGSSDPEADEVEISGPMTVDLRCPITLARPEAPARAKKCLHLTCFELEALLEVMKGAADGRPRCPLCSERLFVVDLYVDALMEEVLRDPTTQDVQKVDFLPDGTWKLPDPSSPARPSASPQRQGSSWSRSQPVSLDVDPTTAAPDEEATRLGGGDDEEVIELLDSSDDEAPGDGAAVAGAAAAAATRPGQVNGLAASGQAASATAVTAVPSTAGNSSGGSEAAFSADYLERAATAVVAAATSLVESRASRARGDAGSRDQQPASTAPAQSAPAARAPAERAPAQSAPAQSAPTGSAPPADAQPSTAEASRRDWAPSPPTPSRSTGGTVLVGPANEGDPPHSPALVGQSPSPQSGIPSGGVREEGDLGAPAAAAPDSRSPLEGGDAADASVASAAAAFAQRMHEAQASQSVDAPSEAQRDAGGASGSAGDDGAGPAAAEASGHAGEQGAGPAAAGTSTASTAERSDGDSDGAASAAPTPAADEAARVLRELVIHSETGTTAQAQVALSDALTRVGVPFNEGALETALALLSSHTPGATLDEAEWAAIRRVRSPLVYRIATQYFTGGNGGGEAGGGDAYDADEEAPPAKRHRPVYQ